jgi:hypothetical protein
LKIPDGDFVQTFPLETKLGETKLAARGQQDGNASGSG